MTRTQAQVLNNGGADRKSWGNKRALCALREMAQHEMYTLIQVLAISFAGTLLGASRGGESQVDGTSTGTSGGPHPRRYTGTGRHDRAPGFFAWQALASVVGVRSNCEQATGYAAAQ